MSQNQFNAFVKMVASFGVLLFVFAAFSSCSHRPVMTKYENPIMRVMIDPDSIQYDQFMMLQTSLLQSGKFIVVDRSSGFKAAKKEQERQHRGEADRFDDREKYAWYGKMYGVGGIVVAGVRCERMASFLSGPYNKCHQMLSLINAMTGEVMAAVQEDAESEKGLWNGIPSWDDIVSDFNRSLPKYSDHEESDALIAFKDQTKIESERQKALNKSISNEDGE